MTGGFHNASFLLLFLLGFSDVVCFAFSRMRATAASPTSSRPGCSSSTPACLMQPSSSFAVAWCSIIATEERGGVVVVVSGLVRPRAPRFFFASSVEQNRFGFCSLRDPGPRRTKPKKLGAEEPATGTTTKSASRRKNYFSVSSPPTHVCYRSEPPGFAPGTSSAGRGCPPAFTSSILCACSFAL